jgi:membrane peptidoglycan carboxypeptidase
VNDAARWALDASVDLSRLARERDSPLHGPFRHEAQLFGGRSRGIVIGPQNPSFVTVAALPQHVVRAITTAEDASFWVHDGFDFHELEDAIAAGARRGQLGRGASTISQQVAKNLWLGRERTLARKAREALLTMALEASLPKRRILEIYVNLAEWGPGIVGLGEAARHYFGEDARDLSPREAAFLASIIPNPIRFHVYCARGELSPAWTARVDDLLIRLWATGVLTTDQLDAALVERLAFTHG